VSQPPLNGPYFLIASIPYWEQVGVYLHALGKTGEIRYWYVFMSNKKKAPIMLFIPLIKKFTYWLPP
jgi:hypothetical protein